MNFLFKILYLHARILQLKSQLKISSRRQRKIGIYFVLYYVLKRNYFLFAQAFFGSYIKRMLNFSYSNCSLFQIKRGLRTKCCTKILINEFYLRSWNCFQSCFHWYIFVGFWQVLNLLIIVIVVFFLLVQK